MLGSVGLVAPGELAKVCLGKVHGPQGVVVNLHRFGQSLRIPTVTLSGDVTALPATNTETGYRMTAKLI